MNSEWPTVHPEPQLPEETWLYKPWTNCSVIAAVFFLRFVGFCCGLYLLSDVQEGLKVEPLLLWLWGRCEQKRREKETSKGLFPTAHSSMSAPIHGLSCFIIIRWHKLMDQMGVKSFIILGYLGFCSSLFSLPYMCKNGEQDANDESWITADAFILMLRLQTPHLFPKHWRSWISNFQIGLYYLSISSSESSRTCQSQTNYSLIAGSFFELTYSMYIFSEEPEIAPSTLRLLSRRTHSICWVTQ